MKPGDICWCKCHYGCHYGGNKSCMVQITEIRTFPWLPWPFGKDKSHALANKDPIKLRVLKRKSDTVKSSSPSDVCSTDIKTLTECTTEELLDI